MKPVFTYTKGMTEVSTSYCPGCTHGIANRIIMEVLEEMGMLGKAIGVGSIGCSVTAHQFMNIDMLESAHGRAPAVATGIRRAQPDRIVFTYQGDGDLSSIGTGEIIHAAHRGEKITAFFINNAIYGMTGGQMAPTTLIGQRTTTSPEGRTVEQAGMPLRFSEILSNIDGAVYLERVALDTPAHVRIAKKAVRRAFEVQMKGLGFGMVEFLSICPSNWGLTPADSMVWLRENMIPYYPLGVIKCPEGLENDK